MSRLLTEEEVERQLSDLPDWHRRGDSLVASLEAPDFPTAIRLVDEVAVEAEELNHHPDIDIRWRKVTFTCSTHSDGGVTTKDIDLARRIDEIIAAAR